MFAFNSIQVSLISPMFSSVSKIRLQSEKSSRYRSYIAYNTQYTLTSDCQGHQGKRDLGTSGWGISDAAAFRGTVACGPWCDFKTKNVHLLLQHTKGRLQVRCLWVIPTHNPWDHEGCSNTATRLPHFKWRCLYTGPHGTGYQARTTFCDSAML